MGRRLRAPTRARGPRRGPGEQRQRSRAAAIHAMTPGTRGTPHPGPLARRDTAGARGNACPPGQRPPAVAQPKSSQPARTRTLQQWLGATRRRRVRAGGRDGAGDDVLLAAAALVAGGRPAACPWWWCCGGACRFAGLVRLGSHMLMRYCIS